MNTDSLDHGDGEVVEEAEVSESDVCEVEALAEAIALEDERRKWVRVLGQLLEKELPEPHDDQIRTAWDLTRIAAFDAIRRVLTGAMPGEVSLD
jgi:hypothetical protein